MKKAHLYDLLVLLLVIFLIALVKIPYLNIFLAFLVVMLYSFANKGIKKALGFKSQLNIIKLLVIAVFLGIGIALIGNYVLLKPLEQLTRQPLQLGPFNGLADNLPLYISSLVIGWVVGGFFEEVIFRGFMITKLTALLGKKTGLIFGVLFSSFLFGYFHSYQGLTGQVLLGLIGIVLALVYVISKRNLWLNILTHGFVNTIGMTIMYLKLAN